MVTLGRTLEEPLQVGLVCVERYDRKVQTQHRGGFTTVRTTVEAVAHEEWRAVEPVTGETEFTFELPREAPYSYEGDCVSYAWRASVRIVRRLSSDPRVDHPVWVHP